MLNGNLCGQARHDAGERGRRGGSGVGCCRPRQREEQGGERRLGDDLDDRLVSALLCKGECVCVCVSRRRVKMCLWGRALAVFCAKKQPEAEVFCAKKQPEAHYLCQRTARRRGLHTWISCIRPQSQLLQSQQARHLAAARAPAAPPLLFVFLLLLILVLLLLLFLVLLLGDCTIHLGVRVLEQFL